jgi:hypothetical protein
MSKPSIEEKIRENEWLLTESNKILKRKVPDLEKLKNEVKEAEEILQKCKQVQNIQQKYDLITGIEYEISVTRIAMNRATRQLEELRNSKSKSRSSSKSGGSKKRRSTKKHRKR